MLVIGLDGATWDVLDPMVRSGRMPNLGRLRERAVWGTLHSTNPPVTFPAWTSFATGVNPGKHGIFDFTRREFGTYDVRFINATYRKAPTVWKRLSDAGRRVCVVGIPGSYPPEAIDGCMISGFDTPVTTRADRSFVHPPGWAADLLAGDGFPFADFQEFRVGPGWHREALARLLRGIATKTQLGLKLLRRERWDCFLLMFGESDTVAHHFWHLHDRSSPRYDAALAATLGDAVEQVYEALDVAIGALLAAADDDTVMLASDHGFGGVGRKTLFLNRWLEQNGLQTRSDRDGELGFAGRVKQVALGFTPASLQARLFRIAGGRLASRLESAARFAGIDWERTTVFSEDLNYFPNLWVNLRGREPQGTVAADDYDRVRTDVIARIGAWVDPESGARIVRRAWRREELYHGPHVGLAPDIVLELALDGGYSYACAPSAGAAPGEMLRVGVDPSGGKLHGLSGSHRAAGAFLLAAPGVTPKAHAQAQIADMAATILVQLGLGIPADFDGLPVGTNGVVEPPSDSTGVDAEDAYGAAEEREIEARLAALGYLQ